MIQRMPRGPFGKLAREELGERLPLEVLKSAAGFYLGTASEDGPVSRESLEYWPSSAQALHALAVGDWTQRDTL